MCLAFGQTPQQCSQVGSPNPALLLPPSNLSCSLPAISGGVLKRPGHTEAAVDLARAAGLPPVGVLCEIVDPHSPNGAMARGPALRQFAADHGLQVITVEDLIE